mmetsp:Transcript_55213/g.62507  ORF Transcript_55213/g.62507 Transcript_55213/m.62507 type:complete len:83 (+) Transcript_55213:79-327(+)
MSKDSTKNKNNLVHNEYSNNKQEQEVEKVTTALKEKKEVVFSTLPTTEGRIGNKDEKTDTYTTVIFDKSNNINNDRKCCAKE